MWEVAVAASGVCEPVEDRAMDWLYPQLHAPSACCQFNLYCNESIVQKPEATVLAVRIMVMVIVMSTAVEPDDS